MGALVRDFLSFNKKKKKREKKSPTFPLVIRESLEKGEKTTSSRLDGYAADNRTIVFS
jgi:hypothetical protein